ncbi:MAG TPA: RDD family protein [Nannocystaceae bacterium]|nr:RDD family protein [Nannocystaceae bacterium]
MDANPFRPPVHEELLSGAELDAAGAPWIASRATRFGAAVIDNIAISIGSAGMGYAFGALVGASAFWEMVGEYMLGLVVSCIVQILLFRDGQSLGKRITNIRIVEYASGRTASVGRILGLRILPLMLLSYATFFALGYVYPGRVDLVAAAALVLGLVDVLPIFGGERRCLHDYLAGTKVVEARR